jgi:hypothetical protein
MLLRNHPANPKISSEIVPKSNMTASSVSPNSQSIKIFGGIDNGKDGRLGRMSTLAACSFFGFKPSVVSMSNVRDKLSLGDRGLLLIQSNAGDAELRARVAAAEGEEHEEGGGGSHGRVV